MQVRIGRDDACLRRRMSISDVCGAQTWPDRRTGQFEPTVAIRLHPDEIVVLSLRYLRSALSCRNGSKSSRHHGSGKGKSGERCRATAWV